MEKVEGEDFGKRCPSLPPNYVSFVQLKERWIQQKQNEAAQKQQFASSGVQKQQPKEVNGFSGSLRDSSKNGLGRSHGQGLHVPRNGESRVVDAPAEFVPRRQSYRNHGKSREETRRQQKSWKLKLRDTKLVGGSETGNGEDKKLYCWKSKTPPMVQEKGLSVQTVSGNGVTPGGEAGYTSYGNERVNEIVSVCMVGLAPEIKETEENPVDSSGKAPGKQVLDDKFSDGTHSLRVEAISLGKQVVDDQPFSTSDSRIVEAKPRGQQPANGQFYATNNDRRIEAKCCGKETVNGQLFNTTGAEGRVNEVEVQPNERYERSGNDKELFEQKNAFEQEVFRDNEEEEFPLGEGRRAGKEKLGSRFQENEGNSRINRNSIDIQQKQGKELGKDFGDLSIQGNRKGNSGTRRRWRQGNLGTALHRKGGQVYGGLVWVKKEVKPDANSAIS